MFCVSYSKAKMGKSWEEILKGKMETFHPLTLIILLTVRRRGSY
jgi:hypothetical protein